MIRISKVWYRNFMIPGTSEYTMSILCDEGVRMDVWNACMYRNRQIWWIRFFICTYIWVWAYFSRKKVIWLHIGYLWGPFLKNKLLYILSNLLISRNCYSDKQRGLLVMFIIFWKPISKNTSCHKLIHWRYLQIYR